MKAHFIGICGTGMSAVAKLLKDAGWEVGGSDEAFYPPTSDYLIEHNIPFVQGYSPSNIPNDADIVVIGKHARLIPEENDEVRAAFESGKAIKSYPEVLQELTQSTANYVVAGSFGKSTCTSIAVWALLQAGKNPQYMVGATFPSPLPPNSGGTGPGGMLSALGKHGDAVPPSQALGPLAPNSGGTGPTGHRLFVLEGDEYPSANWDDTSKFLYFNARHLLITSGEHDHVNVFPTLEDYLKPFQQLVAQPNVETIAACIDNANMPEILSHAKAAVVTYSLRDSSADWYAGNIQRSDAWVEFDLMHTGERVCPLQSRMLGEHNIQNVVGVAALLLGTNALTTAEYARAIESFPGIRRRLELKTSHSRVPLYEDFGSSRPKLIAGIRAVREQFPSRVLHVVFEPHTFSFRNRGTLPWYDDLFTGADAVYVFAPPTHGASSHDQLTLEEIVARIAAAGMKVVPVQDKEELLQVLGPRLDTNSVVLVETSGNIGGALPYLAEYLEETFKDQVS